MWEALLTAFPLDHKRMQTVLLAREIAGMIRWDGDSKSSVNHHFASVTELHRTIGYIGNLSIEDVLKSVLMATLKASTNLSLRDAYHKVLDDLDNDEAVGKHDLILRGFILNMEHGIYARHVED